MAIRPTSGGGDGSSFCAGELILTAGGELAIENLKVGDLAITSSGEKRPIQWIGNRRIEAPGPNQWPVRVTAGAFGEDLPRRDLLLSPGHSICVRVMDEVLVPVGALINGATIAQVEVDEITYWHVELERHDVLLAEGLPCESCLDVGDREWFGREQGRLVEIDSKRPAESPYARPFVERGPVVEAIRSRLTARAEALGWTRTTDKDLHLLVDGKRVDPEIDIELARFIFSAAATDVRLVSRTFIPGADKRRLGVRVEGLHIFDGLMVDHDIPLGDVEGFHPEEVSAGCAWRWTNGDLPLSADLWADCKGLAVLTLTFDPQAGQSWVAPRSRALRAVA